METFIQLGGRLHPLLVHLPIGIIFLIALLEVIGFMRRHKPASNLSSQIRGIRPIMLTGLAISAILAATGGWLLSMDGGYDDTILSRHRLAGIMVAGLSLLLLLVHKRPAAYVTSLAVGLTAVLVAGHYGGVLTHGSGYLVQPFASIFARPEAPQATAMQASAQEPSAFQQLVQPILEERCISCHGPEKQKGRLRLDSWEGILAGGKHGEVLAASPSGQSELVRRITLPPEHDDHMPPEGKPQPSSGEIQIINWWIQHGASPDVTLADLPPPPSLPQGVLLLAAAPPPEPQPSLPPREEVIPLAAAIARDTGVIINYLHPTEPWVEVVARYQGEQFDDASLQRLQPIAQLILKLDLGKTAVSDAGLQAVAEMQNLQSLKLDYSNITGQGLSSLQSLRNLQSLNLVGASISDDALPAVQAIETLRSLYLWRTKVSPEAAEQLRESLTSEPEINSLQSQIQSLQARLKELTPHVEIGGFQAPDAQPESLE